MTQSETFLNEFTELVKKIPDRSKIYPTEYLFDRIEKAASALPDCTIFVLMPKQLSAPDDDRPELSFLILQYLSFKIENKRFHRFQSRRHAYTEYDRIQAEEVPKVYTDTFVLTYSRLGHQPTISHRLLAIICEAVRLHFHFNEFSRLLERSAYRYTQLQETQKPAPITLRAALSALSNNYAVSIAYLYQNGTSLRAAFGDPEWLLETVTLGEEFNYALMRKQTSDCFINDGNRIAYYTLVPNTHNFVDKTLPRGCILLFSFTEPLREQVVIFAKQLLDQYTSKATLINESTIIEQLYEIRRGFMEAVRVGLLSSRSTRAEYLRSSLNSVCTQLVGALGAHSATIRLYNYFEDKLEVFAFCDLTESASDRHLPSEIYGSNYRSSLTAAVFKIRSPLQPVRIDDLERFSIPDDLNELGFEEPLRVRSESVSEICGAIWAREMPIGTINIEAPLKRAFVDYELFITTLARQLGDLFVLTNEALSLPTVMQFGLVNDVAHGASTPEIEIAFNELSSDLRDQLPEALNTGFTKYLEFIHAYRHDAFPENDSPISISKLVKKIKKQYKKCIPPFVGCSTKGEFNVQFEEGALSSRIASSIIRLTDIILSNAARYSKVHADILTINIAPSSNSIGRWRFSLQYKSATPVEREILETFGLVPVKKNGSLRYGAFLLGYHVRSLGGVLDIRQDASQESIGNLEIHLSVPLGEVAKNAGD